MNRIIWLTGESGSGKTTLAKMLQKDWSCIILDGNEMRNSISLGAGFSIEDRKEHNLRVARLAKILSKQINVIVSVIAPIRNVREGINEICNPIWIYVKRTLPKRKGHFYEEPREYFTVNHDVLTVNASVGMIRNFIENEIKKD